MDGTNYRRLASTPSSHRRARWARLSFFLLLTCVVQHISAADDGAGYDVDYGETSVGTTAEETTTEEIISTTSSLNENDFYCREDLCLQYDQFGELVRKSHVACGHDGSFAEDCPAGRTLFKIDPQIRAFIIHLHNEARNRLANGSLEAFESASRMPSVEWNEEMSKLAELNTKSCKFKHDECRNTEQYRQAGQNLALGYYPVEENIFDILEKLTALWFNEYRYANQTVMDAYENIPNVTIGHFTQMMSDRTTSIGCGIVIYPHKVPGYTFKVVLLANVKLA